MFILHDIEFKIIKVSNSQIFAHKLDNKNAISVFDITQNLIVEHTICQPIEQFENSVNFLNSFKNNS